MEKRYQVFVSSTYRDLVDERRAVMQALLELDCIPAGMELFPASDDDQWTLIKRVIDDCDYYLVVLAGRYGSVDPSGIGYTEKEYDYAVQSGKPVIGFVHGDPGSIPQKHTDMDPALQAKLAAFREKVQRKTVRYWTNADESGIAITTSYVRLIKTHPAEGWVKARYARTQEDAEKTARLLEQVQALEKELASLRTTSSPDMSGLAQGKDPVTLAFAHKDAARTGDDVWAEEVFETDWESVFATVGTACVNRPTEGSISAALARWIFQETGARLEQIEVAGKDFRKIKVQLFSLGLIEIERELVEYVSSQRIELVWRLTDRGRVSLANLVGQKKDAG